MYTIFRHYSTPTPNWTAASVNQAAGMPPAFFSAVLDSFV